MATITTVSCVSELVPLFYRELFLIIHNDKAVLHPRPSFLPKVVSDFNFNEDIVFPSMCPAPKHPKENALHCLDVARAISVYFKATVSIRKMDLSCFQDIARDTLLPNQSLHAGSLRFTL